MSKYIGKTGNIEIEWNGVNNKKISDYPYIHQTPPYRVIFTLSKSGISVTFDVPYDFYKNHGVIKIKNAYGDDYYWYFGFDVGFEFWTDDTQNNHIKQTLGKFNFKIYNYTELQEASKYTKTFSEVKWSDLGITNIENYINNNKNIYFKPLCQGCDKIYNRVTNKWETKWTVLHEYIDDGGDRISECVSCDKFVYKIIKAHEHIAKPEITLLKTTGTTIKIKASDGNAFEGILNTDSRYNDSTNNELLFTNLKKETTYTLTIRRKCSCGNYIYSNSKKIKTWNVILDDKKSTDVLNCGGYHRIHVAAKQKGGTIGIDRNSDSGNDGIEYDLYNSINNGANIDTIKTSINHNSGNNYYTERGGRYSSIAKFTGLNSDTYYYCKAYSIDNITNQDNTPDTIKESIFKTAKKFKVDNVSITPKNDKVIISATISNLDDTYIKNNNEYINGLNKLEIGVTQINTETTKTKTLTNLTISNIKNTYSFKISTSVDELSPGTSYNITLDFTGYSKYGIDHTSDTNEKCVRSIQRDFTTTSANGEIINLESSIKAVKFDFKIDDASLGSNDNGSKYKAILYKIYETNDPNSDDPNATIVIEDPYVDKYIEPDNSNIDNRPNYALCIPNNKFTNFENSASTKIVEGLSFGVFNQRNNFDYLYGENDYNTHIESSVGIDCNTTYRIKIVDTTNNDNIIAVYDFDTKQLEAKTNMIIMQDSIKVITKPIIINENFSVNDFSGNTSNIEYKDTDTINTKSEIRTINNDQNSELNYSIGAYAHEDYRSFNDLNYYVDTSDNHDDPNAIFYNYIDNQKIFIYKAHMDNNQNINQEHEIKIINNDQDNQYDHTEIIHEFNNLTYFCYHKIRFYLTDGYNIRLVEVNCNTTYPYIAELHNYTNGVYAGYNRLMAYIFHNGEWRPIIAHTCKKYLDSNNQEYNKWIVVDGDIAYLI